MLRLGCIQYVNALPLLAALFEKKVQSDLEIVTTSPALLSDLLLEKKLDLSFVSSAVFLKHKDVLKPLFPFGIAAKKAANSVFLYHRKPIAHLHDATILVTKESRSSVELLKILCHHVWHVFPKFEMFEEESSLESCDAYLLIGDRALVHKASPFMTVTDLAQAWQQHTQLPMPFAVVAAHIHVKDEDLLKCKQILQSSFDWYQKHQEEVVFLARKTLTLRYQTTLSDQALHNYFQGLTYLFKQKEQEGLQTFENYLSKTLSYV